MQISKVRWVGMMRCLWVLGILFHLSCGRDRADEGSDPLPPRNPDQAGEADQQELPRDIEPDFDWRNMFEGQFWRIHQGQIEAELYQILSLPSQAVILCMQNYGEVFKTWADAYSVRIVQLFATAMTESGCQQVPGSSDGLSSGIMQVTGRTCNNLLRLYDPSRVFISDEACRLAMADSVDLSVELAAMYITDDFQTKQTQVTETLPLHLDPIKVAAGYNAGSLRESRSNDWHLLVTGNHLDRYANAYFSYVENRSEMESIALGTGLGIERDPRLVLWVEDPAELNRQSELAQPGDAVFVGDPTTGDGHFYFFFGGGWHRSAQ